MPTPPWATSQRRTQLPTNWATIRRTILNRDEHRCTRCSSDQRLEVHHIGDRNDHSHANLTTLCHPCHQTETQAEAQAARQARSARRPAAPHPGLRGGG